jgi:hypothetical protein
MNYPRILLGGLVAGVVLNIGEFLLNGMILASQMEEFFRKCGMTPPGGSGLAALVVLTFLLGIFIVYVYAAIRPRYGPGPKTAICAALMTWFCIYLYNNGVAFALGLVPTNVFIIAVAWGFVEYVLAALAGAWLYKEA